MPSIFEVLSKAKKSTKGEGYGWIVTSQNEESNGATVLNGHNGMRPPVSASFAPMESQPESWIERVENILFGWRLQRYKNYPILALEQESQAAEQYKILREKLKRLKSESQRQCVCVMSPVKGDGKTMVAVNLAVAIAMFSDQQVLLIDADLRGPQTHHYFNIKSSPGLSDYLSSSSADEDVTSFIRDTFLPNLRILPAGNPTEFSCELLCKPKMRNVLAEIRSKFHDHQIIIDTSPLFTTPDPLVLARLVDGIIMVARAGKTPHECLLESVQNLGSEKIIGMVLNDVELTIGSKYYAYYKK
jgi:protein-tyrosine kinase